MTVKRFPVEAGHIMTFARAVGDPNPAYYAALSDDRPVVAPPTFVQSSAQFDPDYPLRPVLGETWMGSGREASGLGPRTGGGATSGSGTGLHAEQHFTYHRPLYSGVVLTATTRPGTTWEKQGRRGGLLKFAETVTEYRDADGELVVSARSVSVRTERVVDTEGAS
jgi:hypothetical protein